MNFKYWITEDRALIVLTKNSIAYNKVNSDELKSSFYYLHQMKVPEKLTEIDFYTIKKKDSKIMKIYSLSDGGTPSTTRNKKMFYKCDVYLLSTCFGSRNMKCYESFDTLPGKKGYGIVFLNNKKENIKKFKNIEWSKFSFLSTNGAYNIRSSQILEAFN